MIGEGLQTLFPLLVAFALEVACDQAVCGEYNEEKKEAEVDDGRGDRRVGERC